MNKLVVTQETLMFDAWKQEMTYDDLWSLAMKHELPAPSRREYMDACEKYKQQMANMIDHAVMHVVIPNLISTIQSLRQQQEDAIEQLSLTLQDRDCLLKRGKYWGRRAQIVSVFDDRDRLVVEVQIYKLKGKGFIDCHPYNFVVIDDIELDLNKTIEKPKKFNFTL